MMFYRNCNAAKKVCPGGYLAISWILLLMTQSVSSLFAAQFWESSYITWEYHNYNPESNHLKSAPAYDTSGHVVAVWQRDAPGINPSVYAGRSVNSGTNWTYGNIRESDAQTGVSDRSPVIVTDKSGAWLCVWSSDDPRSISAPADYDILFSRSTDAGASWSPPQLLNSTGTNDSGNDIHPTISMDSGGNCIAAWTSDNDTSDVTDTTSSQTCIWISRSLDAGATWSPAQPMDRTVGESLAGPRLATNGEASFGLVWASRVDEQSTGALNFTWSENAGSTWTETTVINSEGSNLLSEKGSFETAIAGDASGRWMISWLSDNVNVHVARALNNGSTWLPVEEPTPEIHSNSLSLYNDNSGIWIIGSSMPLRQSVVRVSRDFGESWLQAPLFPVISLSGLPYYVPSEGTPFIWPKNETSWNALYSQTTDDPGFLDRFEICRASSLVPPVSPIDEDWSSAKSFVNDGSIVYGKNPRVAADDYHTWVTVYSTEPTSENEDTEIGFFRSSNNGRDWSPPQYLNSDWQTDSSTDSTPVIASSNNAVWLCAWAKSDGKIWLARSFDRGNIWSDPQPVMLEGNIPATGSHPDISSLGNGQWLLVWDDNTIYSAKTTDNGLHWTSPIYVQGFYTLGVCGNSSWCSSSSFIGPAVFSAPGNLTAFVGFHRFVTEWPQGYAFGPEYYDYSAGHITHDGGVTYDGSKKPVSLPGPTYKGSDEMAVDKKSNWLSASTSSITGVLFGQSYNNGELFTRTYASNVPGRTNHWGKVALDNAGNWFRFWAASQYADFQRTETYIFVSGSTNYGNTWTSDTRLNTKIPAEGSAPLNMDVKGNASGNFVAVWQADIPSGGNTIWYANHDKYNTMANGENWQIFD